MNLMKIYYFHSLVGFGHDPETNDYKLVRYSFSKKTIEQIYSRVDVYSLSTNS